MAHNNFYETLFDTHKNQIRYQARELLSDKPPSAETEDDILSAVFLKLLEMGEEELTKKGNNFYGYFKTITKNTTIDLLRKKLPQHTDSLDALPPYQLDRLYSQHTDYQRIDVKIDEAVFFSHLDEKQQKIVLMKSEGYTNKEIGEELNASEAAIKKRVERLWKYTDRIGLRKLYFF